MNPLSVLITGAATGIGKLTALTLAQAGHTVFATAKSKKQDAKEVAELEDTAKRDNLKLIVLELDVLSQESAEAAVAQVLQQAGHLDVAIQNAGHLFVGYAEAFTADELQELFDINVFGVQRVNRAVLPHMRERRSGLVLYVGSTIPYAVPPFLAPYTASKAAMDILAAATAYEIGQFGIESCIVMPGPFTSGTQHFPNASRAKDKKTTEAYRSLDPLVTRNEEATTGMFPKGVDADPQAVADEIARILTLPFGEKPKRSVIDFSNGGAEPVNELLTKTRTDYVTRLGYAELLNPRA